MTEMRQREFAKKFLNRETAGSGVLCNKKFDNNR